jgi:hypothetical protein
MFKKVSLIIFLSILLAAGLIFRHLWLRTSSEPTLTDRLPAGDFLVKAKILDLAQETSGMLHFNKVNFRDFASQEFLLGQAKSYGLDLQRPAYAFVNENGSWGVLIHVSDSSEIGAGIFRLNKVANFNDTVIEEQNVYKWAKENAYITYGKNWLFIYKGDSYEYQLKKVLNSKKGEVNPVWQSFLKEKHFRGKSLVIYSNAAGIQKYGVEKAMFAHNIDSTRITLLSYVKSNKPIVFKAKKEGLGMEMSSGYQKYLNVHLDIEKFKDQKDDPLYKFMARQSRKISFPLDQFLRTWNGDLSFREGGSHIVKETFVESVMDDNFEVTEVVSTKERTVKGFSLALSMNENANNFIASLLKKGILREEEGKYIFLISPPLNMNKKGEYYSFYSGSTAPVLVPNARNDGYLSYKRTPFTFYLDTIIKDEAFGKIDFPVERVLRRNKFF